MGHERYFKKSCQSWVAHEVILRTLLLEAMMYYFYTKNGSS
jgi:hypothetical protein